MKKLITILVIILLASCNYPPKEGDIVKSIRVCPDNISISLYTCASTKSLEHEFIAPTGLYNIGDTIHFVKR